MSTRSMDFSQMARCMAALVCLGTVASVPARGQQASSCAPATVQPDPFVSMPNSTWLVPAGAGPRLRVRGKDLIVRTRDQSFLELAGSPEGPGEAAAVKLVRLPASPSALSGLGVMRDTEHALVIGIEDGNIVLWQLKDGEARVLENKPIGYGRPTEFRVAGGKNGQVQFFWRHQGEKAWHAFGSAADCAGLSQEGQPMRFGLVVDGPLGSQAEFRDYTEAAVEQTHDLALAANPSQGTKGTDR